MNYYCQQVNKKKSFIFIFLELQWRFNWERYWAWEHTSGAGALRKGLGGDNVRVECPFFEKRGIKLKIRNLHFLIYCVKMKKM